MAGVPQFSSIPATRESESGSSVLLDSGHSRKRIRPLSGGVVDLVGVEALEPLRHAAEAGLGAALILLRIHHTHATTLAHRHAGLQ
jgi:hypothetical protein